MKTLDLDAPADVLGHLRDLLDGLEPRVPHPVAAVVLYGGLAKGKTMTATSDVNLLLVLADASPASLAAVAPGLARARRAAGVAPLIVGRGELALTARAFPLKFYDIQRHHRVLLGADPFVAFEVPADAFRENARQALVNLSLRLKRLYVDRAEREDLLLEGLQGTVSAAVIPLRAFLRARSLPVPDHREQVLTAAAKALGVPERPLLRIMELKKGSPIEPSERAADLFDGLRLAVEAAARSV